MEKFFHLSQAYSKVKKLNTEKVCISSSSKYINYIIRLSNRNYYLVKNHTELIPLDLHACVPTSDLFIEQLYSLSKHDHLEIKSYGRSLFNRPSWIQIEPIDKSIEIIKLLPNDQFYKRDFSGYLTPIYSDPKEVKEFFNDIAHEWDDEIALGTEASYIAKKAREYCHNRHKALHVFSGAGTVASRLIKDFQQVDLIDIAPEMLIEARVKHHFPSNTKFVEFDLTKDLNEEIYKLGLYDVICCAKGLHYVHGDKIEKVLNNIYNLLIPNGVFINLGKTSEDVLSYYFDILERTEMFHDSTCPYHVCKKKMIDKPMMKLP